MPQNGGNATGNIIQGFSGNSVSPGVVGATIGGGGASGETNRVTDNYGTIGGGANNQAGNADADPTNAAYATVGGGQGNTASGRFATVGGGQGNTASRARATVGGGYGNTASDDSATVGGGNSNTASGYLATVGGGENNTASGNWATVPGGRSNQAMGDYSFAAGRRAHAHHHGSFVWGDSTNANITSSADNEATFRTSGGFRIFTNSDASVGVQVPPGGNSWSAISDRAVKDNLTPVDGQAVLERLLGIPIYRYTLKSQDPSIQHMGPVAQDFAAAFGLGEDERYIGGADADGVLMAALQGLARQVKEQQALIVSLQQQNASLEARLALVEAHLTALLTAQQR